MKIKVIHEKGTPDTVRPGDAGLDLKTFHPISMRPYETVACYTGIQVAIPSGYVGFITPRSSTGARGIKLKNTVGIIDSNYRGEILLILENISENPVNFKPGDRIAQMVIVPYFHPNFEIVDELDETNRGEDGFGSTGK